MNEAVTRLWADYEHGAAYLSQSGLSAKVPQFVRFFEGQQWGTPTKDTADLPKPVINIVKMICRNKEAALLSVPTHLRYTAEGSQADMTRFNTFADAMQKEMKFRKHKKRAVHDGCVKGTYILHFYWDAEAAGRDGIKTGALRMENVDMLSTVFADPTERDEQKQKWIILRSREPLDAVRAKCDPDVDPMHILPDEGQSPYGVPEQEGSPLCTVVTRYFRRGGEVYCEKATKTAILNRPFPLAPDLAAAMASLDSLSSPDLSGDVSGVSDGAPGVSGGAFGFPLDRMDAPNNSLPDGAAGTPLPTAARAPLYPIVVGNYEERQGSIYGIGEVEGLLPNQKIVNFIYALSVLNAQENAWGRILVEPTALRGQVLTNRPGEVITDYSKTNLGGIRKLTDGGISLTPTDIVGSLVELTRACTGSTEVMTGELLGTNLSGTALAQLQAQASMPIDALRENDWQTDEKCGLVLAQFYRLYYREKEFVPAGADGKATREIFRARDYDEAELDVVCEATQGTRASAAGDITMLNTLLQAGQIDARTYVEAYPADAVSCKERLLALLG